MMSISRATTGFLFTGAFFLIVSSMPASGKKPPGLGDPSRPDLVIDSISVEPWACKNGYPQINVKVGVKNRSGKSAADLSKIPFQQVVKIRVGGNFGSLKSCPGFVDIDPGGPAQIAPGEIWSTTVKRCVVPGGYYVWAQADPLNLVPEFDEKNNYKAQTLNVQDPCKWTR